MQVCMYVQYFQHNVNPSYCYHYVAGYNHLKIKSSAMDDSTSSLQTSLLEERSTDVKLKPMTVASRIVHTTDNIETLRSEEM